MEIYNRDLKLNLVKKLLPVLIIFVLLTSCKRKSLIDTKSILAVQIIPTGKFAKAGYKRAYITNPDTIKQLLSALNNADRETEYFHNEYNIEIDYDDSRTTVIVCNGNYIRLNGISYKTPVRVLDLLKCCFTPSPPKVIDTINYSDSIYRKKDSLCLLINHKTHCIANNASIEIKKAYAGIYRIKGDSLHRSFSTTWGKYVLFTTNLDYQTDTGFYCGYLNVFDTVNKKWVGNGLSSRLAIFVLSAKSQRFFVVQTPWTLSRQKTEAYMFKIKNDEFHYLKSFRFHDDIYTDSLAYFYHQSFGKY